MRISFVAVLSACLVTALVVCSASAQAVSAGDTMRMHASETTFGWFMTPSGNIPCYYSYPPVNVGCGIRSGLKPSPSRRRPDCSVPDRVALAVTGRARLARSICPGEPEGDAGPYAAGQPNGPPVLILHYGQIWRHGGISCSSAISGLTCRNRSGHGFFLSRARWRRF